MNIQDTNIELFDRYLKNDLSEKELSDFNLQLESDPDFAAQFRQYQLMVEGVRVFGRARLKSFMQENKPGLSIEKPKNIYKYWLAAASIVLILGVGIIINLSVKSSNNPEMAVESRPDHDIAQEQIPTGNSDSISMNKIIAPKNEVKAQEYSEMASKQEDLSEPPAINDLKDINSDYSTDDYINAVPMSEGAGTIQVLTDIKTKDTTLYPILLAYESNLDKLSTAESSKNLDMVVIKSSKSKKHLPYNNNTYNNTATPSAKTNSDTNDSTAENQSKTKKSDSNKSVKLNVQYWVSPINFKGYSYKNNVLQLYGLDSKNTSIYQIAGKIYVKSNNIVYTIEPCETNCIFKQETNTEILQIISTH